MICYSVECLHDFRNGLIDGLGLTYYFIEVTMGVAG